MKGFIHRIRFNIHTWHRCIKHCAQRTTDPEQSLWQWPAGREVCQCYIASFETRLDTDQVRQQLLQTSFNILKCRFGVGVVLAQSSSSWYIESEKRCGNAAFHNPEKEGHQRYQDGDDGNNNRNECGDLDIANLTEPLICSHGEHTCA